MKHLILALLSAAALCWAPAHAQEPPGLPWQGQVRVLGAGSDIQLVYLTAHDCVYCRSWRYLRNGGWGRAQASGLAAKIGFVEVNKRTLREPVRADNYPEALRGLHQVNPALGNAVPAWWVLVDGRPVHGGVGESAWDDSIAPLLEDLLKVRAAGGGLASLQRPALNPAWQGSSMDGKPLSADLLPMAGDDLRKAVAAYQLLPPPKALALAEDGEPYYQAGSSGIDRRVLSRCAALTAYRCHLLAIDDRTQPWPR